MTASPEPIKHFVLVYDRLLGRQVRVEEFGTDSSRAVARYQEIEKDYAANPRMDIVLVGSDSLETVKITHANYFDEGAATVEAVESYLNSFTERFVF